MECGVICIGSYIDGNYICDIGRRSGADLYGGTYHVTKYEIRKVEKEPIKVEKVGIETLNSDIYPHNGVDGDRWYVYIGKE